MTKMEAICKIQEIVGLITPNNLEDLDTDNDGQIIIYTGVYTHPGNDVTGYDYKTYPFDCESA